MTVNHCATLTVIHPGMMWLMIPWRKHPEMVLFAYRITRRQLDPPNEAGTLDQSLTDNHKCEARHIHRFIRILLQLSQPIRKAPCGNNGQQDQRQFVPVDSICTFNLRDLRLDDINELAFGDAIPRELC